MFRRRSGKRTEEIRSEANDSVTTRGDGHPEYSGKNVTRRAEDFAREETPAGRVGEKSTGRFASGVGADTENPIDKKSPYLTPA